MMMRSGQCRTTADKIAAISIIHGIVRQRTDVEDIAQQVFSKVYFSIRNFDFRSSLITWIYKITVNECFDYLRKKKVRKLVYESDMSEDEVRHLVKAHPEGRQFSFLGEPVVNVLELNLDLDSKRPRPAAAGVVSAQ